MSGQTRAAVHVGREISDEAIEARHHLHEWPERSHEEYDTTAYLTEFLTRHGIEVVPTPLKTGVIGVIRGTDDPVNVLLRADIDGLPVAEHSAYGFHSHREGVMHACGHDTHMATLLGAALYLQRHRDLIIGRVTLLFQPAEEYGGAEVVAKAHLIDDADALVGFYNDPRTAPGTVGISKKPIMADAGIFTVTLHGHGCHAAYPHKGRSPIEAAATLVGALQTIVSRNLSPLDSAVVSVTQIHAGDVYNVIPSEAMIDGTIREFSPQVLALIKTRFYELVDHVAKAYGITASVDRWLFTGAAVVSDPRFVDAVSGHVNDYAQLIEPEPSFGGEDFSYYLKTKPGLFALIGSNGDTDAAAWHSPDFVAKDETIPVAIDYFVNSAFDLADWLIRHPHADA